MTSDAPDPTIDPLDPLVIEEERRRRERKENEDRRAPPPGPPPPSDDPSEPPKKDDRGVTVIPITEPDDPNARQAAGIAIFL